MAKMSPLGLGSKERASKRGNGPDVGRAAPSGMERLEARTLLTTMSVTGTAGDDLISLTVNNGFVTAVVNGTPAVQSDLIVTAVAISALGGDDRIVIHSNGSNPVTINGGSGNDTIEITPTSQNLDDIGAEIAIDGQGGFNAVQLFDNNKGTSTTFAFSGGNQITRSGGKSFTAANVAVLDVQAGSGGDTFSLQAPTAFALALNGNAGTDLISVNFGGSGNIIYRPHASVFGSGSLDLGPSTASFTSCSSLFCLNLSFIQVITPNAQDNITVHQLNDVSNRLFGTSGGVSIMPLNWSSISQRVFLDLGISDGIDPTTNTITLSDNLIGSPRFGVEAGSLVRTSTNTMAINGGNWIIENNVASNRRLWDVSLNGASTDVTFVANEASGRLEVNSGATVRFSGTGNDVVDLAVTNGTGNVEVAPGGLLEALGGFSIAAGATLRKIGNGVLTVGPAATQNHGTGSIFNVHRGTANLLGDAGTTTVRRLTVTTTGGNAIFHSTQHLAAVFSDTGVIRMAPNGDRVLVTDDVAVNGESGQIDLTDNDMIVDYTAATRIEEVRLLLRGGFANGAWNGIGIASSAAAAAGNTALGYAEATDFFTTFPATFSGEPVGNTAILIKYTFYGDSNFDGRTNLSDFNILAANFGATPRRWVQGDYTYDLAVNLADFNRLAGAFGRSGLSPEGRGSSFDAADDDDGLLSQRLES